MNDVEVERIKRFLNAKGYLVRKSDVIWILNQMLERQIEEANGIVERQLLCEVIKTAKDVKIITELPGIIEDTIKINAYDNELEINAENDKRRYHELIHLPAEAKTSVLKSTYLNGFLEVTLEKRKTKKRVRNGNH